MNHPLLMKLPFVSYVTTNFDTLLRDASFGEEDIKGVYYYPDLPSHRISERSIFYIHGIVEKDGECRADKLVLGKESFQKAYSEDSLLPSFLKNLFAYFHVVFLGFSLRDPSIQDILQITNKIQKEIISEIGLRSDIPERYILLEKRHSDNQKLKELGVHTIEYELWS